jgi:SAM-dependent methyltransferase
MTTPFKDYAPHYDLLYRDKDYFGEAQFVRRLLERFLGKPVEQTSLLDLACGTGRHACELALMGFEVEGSDISPDMVAVARESASRRPLQISFHNESFQSCDRIGRTYDSVIAMFSAINYLTTYQDLTRSLKNIRSLLKEGGVFCFDFWNGNAVLKNYSPVRVRRAQSGEDVVIRTSHTTLDQISQIATIVFDFMLIRSGRVLAEFSETHYVRYFFPQEMMDTLTANGFEVVCRCPFLLENNEIAAEDWNLTYIAKPCA